MQPTGILARLDREYWTSHLAPILVAWFVVSSAMFVGIGFAGTPTDPGQLSTQDAAPSAPPTGLVDLANSPTTLTGAAAGDQSGWSVASAGDVNGDGVDDVLVAAPFSDAAGNESGAVYLFYGPVDEGDVSLADAEATFVGESSGDWAGYSVAAGDVNGDGRSDIVVGAPHHDGNGVDSGAVYVIDGARSPSGTISLSDANAKMSGESEHDEAGWSVAARDVAGTDIPSVVAGAPTDQPNLQNGAAYVLSMDAFEGSGDLSGAEAKLVGEANGDLAGWSVDWASDVTGDGTDHVIVGARLHDTAGDDAGAAYLVEASTSGVTNLANANVTFLGVEAGDNAGFAVAGLGDVDGDGVDDVGVGAPLSDEAGTDAGTGYIAFGSGSLSGVVDLANVGGQIRGEGAGDRLGWSVASAGDVDDDGRDDLLLGAPNQDGAGAAYLVYGSSTAGQFGAAKLQSEEPGDMAGFSVAGAGDTDGDGLSDVLVGAPGRDTHPDAGATYLLFGASEDRRSTTTTIANHAKTETVTDGATTGETKTERDTPTKTKSSTETQTPTKTEKPRQSPTTADTPTKSTNTADTPTESPDTKET